MGTNAIKLDLAKMDKTYYGTRSVPTLIELAPLPYVVIDGKGDPDTEVFKVAVEALYSVAYGVKMMCKKEGRDFTVAKLEGQWWVEDAAWEEANQDMSQIPRSEWLWRLIIRMLDFVDQEVVDKARQVAAHKKKELDRIDQVSYERIHEGLCVQMLHIGPFRTEPETVKVMEAFMKENSLHISGLHHEIYLSDFRRVEPSARKTILRYPVTRTI
ncbi:GyrI-like domain-containing protein [Paenibacillus sp. N1-5-1-14]|uniref:GyrI-like domain-containing protein n=1 Tax=Paenibacillus radicibacter TaxID=2972488 RepID=UPI00215951F5|nr:GyrI-like domain-containing protein [Paenibacillus radicibacter]MCR8643785.1 GyrI-like domain-containing protein [Paenibacillus radicibacter]